MKRFTLIALALALVLGVLIAPHASKSPDGLSRVAEDQGFAHRAKTESTYGRWAGLTGTLLVFALGTGIVLVRRRA